MNDDQLRTLLRRQCELAGGQKAWAQANGLSGAFVTDVLRARRAPGRKMLKALGLQKEVVYRKASPANKTAAAEAAAWLIWSGERKAWWRPGAQGYSGQVGGAGRFTLSEARAWRDHAGPEKQLEIVPDPYGPEAENCSHAP